MSSTSDATAPLGRSFEVAHPLIQHHLTQLRDKATPPAEFRRLIQRLSVLLAYEATGSLRVRPHRVQTPVAPAAGFQLDERIGLIPILRAGLGMVDPILDLIPSAEVWHLGLYRDESTAQPVQYYSKLPVDRPVDVALVLDPMLATGGSALLALSAMRDWGVPRLRLLSVIASQDGVRAVHEAFPEADIYVCAVDDELNAQKFIVPGLGDAGDRTFHTT